MFIKTFKSTNSQRAIALASHHARSKPRQKEKQPTTRTQSQFNSKTYRDALQRAFNRAKLQIYFNPDMTSFITLTYKGTNHTPENVLYDVKQLIKTETRNGTENLKYIYVMEYQKRGSIHVHMIANDKFSTYVNKNGYMSLTNWQHGFSSVLKIDDFDNNFKPYLYLFKYMRKAQRIGKSFLHSSRNLNNYEELKCNPLRDETWEIKTLEKTEVDLDYRTLRFYRYFLERR